MVVDNESASAIREYYGKVLQGKRDLKTTACCCAESIPESHREILAEIDGEVLEKFYGCGFPFHRRSPDARCSTWAAAPDEMFIWSRAW